VFNRLLPDLEDKNRQPGVLPLGPEVNFGPPKPPPSGASLIIAIDPRALPIGIDNRRPLPIEEESKRPPAPPPGGIRIIPEETK
jgi:hypothetical protein